MKAQVAQAPVPFVLDVLDQFQRLGVTTKRGGGDELRISCPYCPDGDPKLKMYVNTIESVCYCFRCGRGETARELLRDMGADLSDMPIVANDPAARVKMLTDAALLLHQNLLANDEALLYLMGEERGLSEETILDRKYGWLPAGYELGKELVRLGHDHATAVSAGLVFSDGRPTWSDRLILPYWTNNRVVQLRAKDISAGGKYQTAAGDRIRIYGVDDLRDADEVLVTEGEFDRDILKSVLEVCPDARLRRMGVVGIPGASSSLAEWATHFADAKRVYLGFDSDDAGLRAATKGREALGPRARVLAFPESYVERARDVGERKLDWTVLFSRLHGGWADVQEMLSTATGRRVFSGFEVNARWRRDKSERPGVQLGFRGLDEAIRPGLKPGQVMIPLARTGAGKTVFLCNIAFNTRAHRTLFVSLEMTAEEVWERLMRIARFYFPGVPDSELIALYPNLMIADENRLTTDGLEALVDEVTEEGGAPELLLVDYLGYFAHGQRGATPYERTSNAAMALKAVAKAKRVATVAPHQVNRGAEDGKPLEASAARDAGVVEETGDFVLGLFRPDDTLDKAVSGQQPTGNVVMQLLKSRHGGKGKTFPLVMAMSSLVLLDRGSSLEAQAEQENYLTWRDGYTYEVVMEKQAQVYGGKRHPERVP